MKSKQVIPRQHKKYLPAKKTRKKRRLKDGAKPKCPKATASWLDILSSSFETELLRTALRLAWLLFWFAGAYVLAALMLGGFLSLFIGLLRAIQLAVGLGGLLLAGILLRWQLAVIHHFAGKPREIDPYDISFFQAIGFYLIMWGVALAITFPTVILPMKLVFGLILPETAPAHADWGFACLLGFSFMMVYFQMACAVLAVEGDQDPTVVLIWLWKVLPGLPGFYLLSTAFVMIASMVSYVAVFSFLSLSGVMGTVRGWLPYLLVIGCLFLAFVFQILVYSYLNLVPFAMFGKFLRRYHHRLDYRL